jgi:hypothetical protein
MREGGESTLGVELKRFMDKAGVNKSRQEGRLQSVWEKVASEEVLAHTDNVLWKKNEEKRTVLVYVDGSAWAAELRMYQEYYKLLLSKELETVVDEIHFNVSRIASLKKEFKKQCEEVDRKEEFEPYILSAQELEEVAATVAGIENEELRQRLFKAIKGDLEWKKGITSKKMPQKP